MKWQHLQAFVWLRWRIQVNQMRRMGIANAVILGLLAVAAAVWSVGLFVGFLLLGFFALAQASPAVLLYVWDGLIFGFILFWATGLLVQLQRSELLSIEKFLHLPISVTGVYLINYLSSLLSLSMILFLPAAVGLCIGLAFAKGPLMLLQIPLLAAFLLAVTALTYHFQGWLATLMVNKRRRRTVIAMVTMGFVLIFQLPQLFNIAWQRRLHKEGAEKSQQASISSKNITELSAGHTKDMAEMSARFEQEWSKVTAELKANKITRAEYQRRREKLLRDHQQEVSESQREYNQRFQEFMGKTEQRNQEEREQQAQIWQDVEQSTRFFNLVVPLGWMPLGAMSLAENKLLPPLLGALAFGLVGSLSLWRSYRTTLRFYTGQFTAGKKQAVVAPPQSGAFAAGTPAKDSVYFLERKLPGVSEQAAAIALAGFRSLLRAPEAKMLLLTPVILLLVFGSMAFAQSWDLPKAVRPLVAFGAMAIILVTLVGLAGNQFAFDRSGFRAFVLCSASRKEILLGKNLAIAPLALGMAGMVVIFIQAICPMRFDHFLALLFQMVSAFLLFCLLANWLSILFPMPIAAGSLKPASPKLIPILLQVLFTFLIPLALLPLLSPLGIEYLLEAIGWSKAIPICLILSVPEFLGVVYLYRLVLSTQGTLLHAREQTILGIVVTKAE